MRVLYALKDTWPNIFEISWSARLSDLPPRIAEDGGDAASIAIGVDKGRPFNAIAALPFDREAGIGLPPDESVRSRRPGQSGRKPIGDVQQPGVSVSVENRTFLFWPKFARKEQGQMNLSRFHAIAQMRRGSALAG